jgi:hypothetical protein
VSDLPLIRLLRWFQDLRNAALLASVLIAILQVLSVAAVLPQIQASRIQMPQAKVFFDL